MENTSGEVSADASAARYAAVCAVFVAYRVSEVCPRLCRDACVRPSELVACALSLPAFTLFALGVAVPRGRRELVAIAIRTPSVVVVGSRVPLLGGFTVVAALSPSVYGPFTCFFLRFERCFVHSQHGELFTARVVLSSSSRGVVQFRCHGIEAFGDLELFARVVANKSIFAHSDLGSTLPCNS